MSPAQISAGPGSEKSATSKEEVILDPQGDEEMRVPVSLRSPNKKRFRFEFGVFPLYRSNLFQAIGGAPKTSVLMTTTSVKLELDFIQTENSTMTGEFLFRRNLFSGITVNAH